MIVMLSLALAMTSALPVTRRLLPHWPLLYTCRPDGRRRVHHGRVYRDVCFAEIADMYHPARYARACPSNTSALSARTLRGTSTGECL